MLERPANTTKSSVVVTSASIEGRPRAGPSARANNRPESTATNRCPAHGEMAVAIDPEDLGRIFGTEDPEVTGHLMTQLLGVLHPDVTQPIDERMVNAALGMLRGIAPGDGLEAMLAVQMVAAEHGVMDMMRRALHPDQTPAGRETYVNLATRLMRAFAAQLEALNRGRGKSSVQRVVVERVDVRDGGQAVVGAGRHWGRGTGGWLERTIVNPAHATGEGQWTLPTRPLAAERARDRECRAEGPRCRMATAACTGGRARAHRRASRMAITRPGSTHRRPRHSGKR